jgi:hypothetical protein
MEDNPTAKSELDMVFYGINLQNPLKKGSRVASYLVKGPLQLGGLLHWGCSYLGGRHPFDVVFISNKCF